MLEDARIDHLTGFFLRDTLNEALEELIYDAATSKKGFSIALIDLDRFKKFNDRFGHAFGDEILKYATSILRWTLGGPHYRFFRYGGDEFIVVFLDKDAREAIHLLRKCIYNMRHRPFLLNNKFHRITMSTGVATFPNDGQTAEHLVKRADKAMYFSKHHGRNIITPASKMLILPLRDIFIWLVTIGMIVWVIYLLQYLNFFKEYMQPVVNRMMHVQIVTKPQQQEDLDVIVLKSGSTFAGKIIDENDKTVTMRLFMDTGEGLTKFNKSNIAKIKYSGK